MPDRNDRDNDRQPLGLNKRVDQPQRIEINVRLSPLEIKIIGGSTGSDSTAVLAAIQQLVQRFTAMSAQLDALTAQVERNTSVDQSAITLLNGLADQIRQLKADPVALQKLADDLTASSSALADAVVANTPAEDPQP